MLDFTCGFNAGTANNANVASIANNRDTNRSQNFTYDELNRIDVASSPKWSLNHDYDIWGNLWQITPTGAPGL